MTPQRVQELPKAEGLSGLVSVLTSRPGLRGTGFVYATGEMTSTIPFDRVRCIKRRRALKHIKLSLGLNSLRVYVPAEDFDMVYDFVSQQCSRIRGKK